MTPPHDPDGRVAPDTSGSAPVDPPPSSATGLPGSPPTPETDRPDDRPDREHRRPPGLDDDTVAALGKLSEALETVERARGHLYSMHQLIGHADLSLDEAVRMFRAAGHHELAERITDELIGRNVIAGRWTFQIVEDFDDGYYAVFRGLERHTRDRLAQGRRHLYEAEMKEQRRTHGRPGHEARPAGG